MRDMVADEGNEKYIDGDEESDGAGMPGISLRDHINIQTPRQMV